MRRTGSGRQLASISGFLFLFVWLACANDREQTLIKLDRGIVNAHIGDIDIRGSVVSENGEPLSGVTIKYFFREFGDQLSERKIDYKRIEVDGTFRIRGNRISSVNLSFLKDGYYPSRWSFGFHPETPRQNPGGVEELEIEIVLQKEPIPAPLQRYEGILRAEREGPVSVVGLKRRASGETWLRKGGQKRALDGPYVCLVAANGKNAQLPMAEFQTPGDSRIKQGLERGWIRFRDLSEGDGFVVHDPGQVWDWPEIGMRGMIEAPENGYRESLELSAVDGPPKVYFYFRIGGQYGKGMVSGRPVIAEEDGAEVARAAILLYLNPTGSRDVSYLHD